MPKPTTLPEWASNASAAITEPTATQKQAGWTVRQKPPAQYLNWWQKLVYNWIQYVNGLTGEALTWTVKQTFNAGLATPVAPAAGSTDVANAAYVDGKFPLDATRHGAQTSGTLHAAATTSVAGFMSATDKTKLDNATASAIAGRVVARDVNGRAQFADPFDNQDVDTKVARDRAIASALLGTDIGESFTGGVVNALGMGAESALWHPGGGGFLVVAGNEVRTSVDGTTWVNRGSIIGFAQVYDLATNGSRIVGVGQSGNFIYSDDHGATWVETAATLTTQNLWGVAYSGSLGRWIAVGGGANRQIFSSPNGLAWALEVNTVGGALQHVIWDGSQFIAAGHSVANGANGQILTSPTGLAGTWTSRLDGVSNYFTRVAANGEGTCVAVGNGGIAWFSSNAGINWNSAVTGTTVAFKDLKWLSVPRMFVGLATVVESGQCTMTKTRSGASWRAFVISGEYNTCAWNPERELLSINGNSLSNLTP